MRQVNKELPLEFKKSVEDGESNTLAIDFDGVIHKNSKGLYDGTVYDEPMIDSFEALKELSDTYKIIVFTCKANPNRPLLNGKTGTELVWEWLNKHNMSQYVNDVVWGKPNAIRYIDDKGYYFQSWKKTLKDINEGF